LAQIKTVYYRNTGEGSTSPQYLKHAGDIVCKLAQGSSAAAIKMAYLTLKALSQWRQNQRQK
jgi:hypothetical protein